MEIPLESGCGRKIVGEAQGPALIALYHLATVGRLCFVSDPSKRCGFCAEWPLCRPVGRGPGISPNSSPMVACQNPGTLDKRFVGHVCKTPHFDNYAVLQHRALFTGGD